MADALTTAPPPTVWPALRAHAELARPLGGGVMLGEVRDHAEDAWPQAPGTSGAHVVTDEVDVLHAGDLWGLGDDRGASAG